MSIDRLSIEQLLKRHWGHPSLRPGQWETISAALAGRDALAVMPTGGGKSLCYQLPCLARPGMCLVITPLVALMQDQVDGLKARGIPAVAIHSGMGPQGRSSAWNRCRAGDSKFLFLAPERLGSADTQTALRELDIALLAVDEAHCISEWGHDFRPAYRRIAEVREHLPQVPVMALTATATLEVEKDITEQLELKPGFERYRGPFVRANLSLTCQRTEDKYAALLYMLKAHPGSGLVYTRSRRRTEEICRALQQEGRQSAFYHAGLSSAERGRRQRAWIEEKVPLMVATNAFGMGIDKASVRIVVHWDTPESPESYFQEAGRAGRDGQPATAALLFTVKDLERLWSDQSRRYPPEDELRRVYTLLHDHLRIAVGDGTDLVRRLSIQDFSKLCGCRAAEAMASLQQLARMGWINLSDGSWASSAATVHPDRRGLHRLEEDAPALAAIQQAMLRSYAGILSGYVSIDERGLARSLGLKAGDVEKGLQQLQRRGLLRYRPASSDPFIEILRARVSPQHFSIDRERYAAELDRQTKRTKAMERYAMNTERCRGQLCREYFGEESVTDACGICDVCQSRDRRAVEPLILEISTLLKERPCRARNLIERMEPKNAEAIVETLTWLRQEGWIEEDRDQRLSWTG